MKTLVNDLKIVLIICAGIFLFSGCEKDPIRGCMSSSATNYDSSADEDDGSCEYSAKLVFYQEKSKSTMYASVGTTTLKFYINNEYKGSASASKYQTASPGCSGINLFSCTQSLGNSKTKSLSYSIIDEEDFEWYKGTFDLTGSLTECVIYKLP